MNALNSEEGIAWQIQTLVEDLCSLAEDPAGCAESVETWWALMSSAVYTHRTSAAICHGLDPEGQRMARLMDSPEAAQAIAHHLEGPAFCQSEELGLDEEQVQECMENVRRGAVKGFQYIFKIVGEHAR